MFKLQIFAVAVGMLAFPALPLTAAADITGIGGPVKGKDASRRLTYRQVMLRLPARETRG